jgi:transposase
MTPGTNRRRSIFGAVDVASGRCFYQVARRAVSAGFTAFLAQLLASYPAAPVVAVVCDNVLIHRSKLVNRWLAAHPRVRVLHGARYSPHDNPTERIWGALKAWLRPMRGLKQDRSARVAVAGHALVQNVRRRHYELAVTKQYGSSWISNCA